MRTETNLTAAAVLAASFVLTACGGPGVEGKWVEPVPGMEGLMQGVELEADGKASSINMATLQYEKWEMNGDTLVLTGKSIGNGQTIDFADTLVVEKLTGDALTLKRGDMTVSYQRQK